MLFTETQLQGAYIVDLQLLGDDRGFFARTWCQREFSEHGLDAGMVQCSLSYSMRKGTLRGLHYQEPPFAETKLVRCTHGAIYDVIVDLRRGSETFLQWIGVELTAQNRRALVVPKGFAHGFQTLCDDTEVFYQMSEFHAPEAARGIRCNDPLLGISWPEEVTSISPRDREYRDLHPAELIAGLAAADDVVPRVADGC
jgi:dTDP-4-dehydrorhamnose 3,5-epimerase